MSNETKHRPSEVLLQLMRYAWDPKFLTDDLEIGIDDAIAAYIKMLEMEAGEIPEQNAWDPKFLADDLEIGMDDAVAAYNKIPEMEAGEIPEQNAGRKPSAAPPKAPSFSGPGAKEKKKLHARLTDLINANGPGFADKLAMASYGDLSASDILLMKERGGGSAERWHALEDAITAVEQQDAAT